MSTYVDMISAHVDTTGERCLRLGLIPILEAPKPKMAKGPSYPIQHVNGDPRVLLFPAQTKQQAMFGGNVAEPKKLFAIWRELSQKAQEVALAEILEIASAAEPKEPLVFRSDQEN